MKRSARPFLTLTIIYPALLSGLLLLLAGACTVETDSRPNVILIITDDQGYGEIGAHGNDIIQTPNLDQFYDESVRFTNFHVGTTCAPTRAGLMTARNCNRNGVWHTIGGCSLLNIREETIADVFSSAGYATGMFGKWHLGDTYPFRPHDRGFNEAFYHGGGGVGQTPDFWDNDYFDDTYFRNGVPEKTSGYCTDVWFKEALDFIESHRTEPFFCYLSTNAPHGPFNLPEEYLDIYEDAELMAHQKRFYGMITNIDDNFGALLGKLEEWGISDNTIVIFMTDNGTAAGIATNKKTGKSYGFNSGMRGTKGSQYDGGHRVPFIMRWDGGGLNGGRDISTLAAHVDVLPTLAELCAVPYQPQVQLDGTSLGSLLLRGKDLPERMLVTDTQRNQWPEKGRRSCVMEGQWRLVNGVELYHLNTDPGQKKDLAKRHPEKVSAMQGFYDEWWAAIESEFEYSRIILGSENQNPVVITCHDMHTDDAVAWHQEHIRDGKLSPAGYYSIEVEKPGAYEFRLSRWPEESGLMTAESIPGIMGTRTTDAIPEGKGRNLKEGVVIIEGIGKISAKTGDHGAVLETRLERGPQKMEFYFLDDEDSQFAAYYISIRKL